MRTITREKALESIRREFPERRWKNARIPLQGWDHFTLLVDDEVLFRFPLRQLYRNLLPTEIRLLDSLQGKLPLCVPHYTYISRDRTFAGYEIIPGTVLRPDSLKRFSAAKQRRFIREMAAFLSELHSTPLRGSGRNFGARRNDERGDLMSLRRNTTRFLRRRFSQKDHSVTDLLLGELESLLSCPHDHVLIHNDLAPEHILFDANTDCLTGIIDFSDRAIGDPAHDFAGLWEYGEDIVQAIYERYFGPKDPHFLSRSLSYFRRSTLSTLIGIRRGNRGSFTKALRLFRKVGTMEPFNH